MVIMGVILSPLITSTTFAQVNPEAFFFYFGQEKVPLKPSTEMVAVRFVEDLSPQEMEAIIESEANLQPLAEAHELPELGLFLLKVRGGMGEQGLLRLLASLNAGRSVAFANPAFRFPDAQQTMTDEFVAQFKASVSQDSIARFNARQGVDVVQKLPWVDNTYILRVRWGNRVLETANLYAESGLVHYAEPNWVRLLQKAIAPNDTHYPEQWGMENTGTNPPDGVGTPDADMDAEAAWDITTGSSNIVIAIVDEGVELAHEDLDDKIAADYSAIPGDADGGDPNNTWDAHGTNCAGIAAAESNNSQGVAGVCWNCSLMAVQIAYSAYDGGPWITYDTWIADGLTWAVDHGADILSNSWYMTSPSSLVNDAIHYTVTQGRGGLGSVVLFAVGNDDHSPVRYPASNNDTIAVGATSPCDERKNPSSCDGESWWGANYGVALDVVAPGVEWWSTDMMGTSGYDPGDYFDHMNGTSSAAPAAAGLAGLILSYKPCLNEGQVQEIMEQSADDQVGLPGEDIPGWDQYMGWGRINAAQALGLAQVAVCSELDASKLYAVEPYAHISRLISIDTETTDVQTVTALTGPDITSSSLAFSPDGDLIGVDLGRGLLYRIDISTGQVTHLGSSNPVLQMLPGLAFDREGNLYGLHPASDTLVSIDPSTGATTEIGPLGIDVMNAGLAIDFRSNELYAVMGKRDSIPDKLLRIDKETGQATVIGPLGVDLEGVGVEFSPVTGQLFAVRDYDILMEIDVSTGGATQIGILENVHTNNLAALWGGDGLPVYHGLVVGVADYPGSGSDLRFTDDDAREIRDALLRYGNWDEANIQLLIDSAATKPGIQAAIAQIGAVADADDVVLVFFSGHGTTGPDVAPLDEADSVDEYTCPYGSALPQYIRDDELSEWLGELPTTNVVVIVDTCFSGGQVMIPGVTLKSLPGTPSGVVQEGDGFTTDLTQRITPQDMDDNAGCVVLTAADEDELSYEFAFLRNGLFSFFAIAGLERYPDLDGNGELSAEELFVYPWIGVRWLGSHLGIDQHSQLHDDYPAGDSSAGRLGVGIGPPSGRITSGDTDYERLLKELKDMGLDLRRWVGPHLTVVRCTTEQ